MKKLLSIILILCLMIPFVSFSEVLIFGTGKVYVRAQGGTLHLRSEPTTESESLGIVHHGDEIGVLSLGDEWSYIFSYREGRNGYIKTKYIVDFVPAENMYNELTIESATNSSGLYPIPGKYHIDLDDDGIMDTANASLFYDEYGNECFTITFKTAYGSTGEANIPFSSYAAGFAFLKLDETDRVYVFVTGDVASSDFETYCFYVENGRMRNLHFSPAVPFKKGLDMPGALSEIEDGVIVINTILDVLGTRGYDVLMKIENDEIVPFESAPYATTYDLDDPEIWEYAALQTKTSVPCHVNGNAYSLDPDTKLIVTWLNIVDQEIGFTTQSGLSGYFEYEQAADRYWGVNVGGIFEEDAFYYIPYAG